MNYIMRYDKLGRKNNPNNDKKKTSERSNVMKWENCMVVTLAYMGTIKSNLNNVTVILPSLPQK